MNTDLTAVPIPANGKIEPTVYTKPVGQFQLLRLTPQDPFTRKLFPAFVERCLAFTEVMNGDTDNIWLGATLFSNFYQQTNYIHCLVAINDKEEIRAHSFAYVDQSDKLGHYVNILQVWKSEGGSEILEEGLRQVEEWAKELKIKTIINTSDTLARSRLYERFGFKVFRVLGKKEIS